MHAEHPAAAGNPVFSFGCFFFCGFFFYLFGREILYTHTRGGDPRFESCRPGESVRCVDHESADRMRSITTCMMIAFAEKRGRGAYNYVHS